MNNKLFQLTSWFTYWLDALDAHSLHSPFLYDFYTQTVRHSSSNSDTAVIEELRKKLLSDSRSLEILDLGAGSSSRFNGNSRAVRDIAQTSLSPRKYSLLYKRIIEHYHCQTVVELGTSLGINTLYLSSSEASSITTFEGSPAIADTARELFNSAGAAHINIIQGNIESTLPDFIDSVRNLDFVFLDANHRYQPTIDYFNHIVTRTHSGSVVVLDDIYYSREMAEAWKAIQQHDKVCGTADLYRCGIVFFNPSLNKQHVVLQF